MTRREPLLQTKSPYDLPGKVQSPPSESLTRPLIQMKYLRSSWLATGLGLAIVAALCGAQAGEKKEQKEKGKPAAQPKHQRPTPPQPSQNRTEPGHRLERPTPPAGPGHGPAVESPAQRENQNRPVQAPQVEPAREPKVKPAKERNAKGPDWKGNQAPKNSNPTNPKNSGTETQIGEKRIPSGDSTAERLRSTPPPATAPVQLTEHKRFGGTVERKRPSGTVAETVKVDRKTGAEQTRRLTPSGRIESEVIKKRDGSVHKSQYDLGGAIKREEVVQKDGARQVIDHRVGRDNVHIKETINYNANQTVVSKTVEKNITINNNITINKSVNRTVVVNHYDRGRYGFVYRPVYVARPHIFVSWYDPYWYSPVGVVIHHPFRWTWGWERHGWYHHYHGVYWSCYPVYPAPSYWVCDFLFAAYVADRFASSVSAAQAQEEARLAREEAQKARIAAEAARDQAEIAEARAAAAQSELRARNAEERAARAERQQALAGKNPNASPVDEQTKEMFRSQIERTIAEQKELAQQSEKAGKPVLPDLAKTLSDPKHIYPVSKTLSVVAAKDNSPAGIISEGDLLKVEPGQEHALRNADENTEVAVRVMSSKGEENEVAAGTVVKVFVRDLQEFDSEFRAKLDEGLAAAESNKEGFKQSLVAQKN
jgi:hypothetical protein